MTSRALRRLTGVAAAALAAACETGPTPPRVPSPAQLHLTALLSASSVTKIVVTVSAADISPSLVYNFPVAKGVAMGDLVVPAGSDRHFRVSAFDAAGVETHRADTTIAVESGSNPPLAVTLTPLTGTQPIVVTISGLRIEVQPTDTAMSIGTSAQYRAQAFDGSGNNITDRVTFTWATSNPSVASVDSQGAVTAHLADTVFIVAVAGGAAGVATLTVFAQSFSIDVSVIGGGHVVSTPAGISCTTGEGRSCTADFPGGTSVTLNAVADDDWEFGSWGGDCAGGLQQVTVVMTGNRSCAVAFRPLLRVGVTGSGTVTSSPAGINCLPSCIQDFPLGTEVTLSATPASGRVFSGWSGDCTGTGDCVVTMSAAREVRATFFDPRPASLVIAPKPLIIEVGAHPNIDVVVEDGSGNVIRDAEVTFASRNPSVASFSPGGIVNGLAPGQSVVVATASGGSAPSDSLLAVVAVSRGPVLMTDITQFDYHTDTVASVTVVMDMRNSGESLGSTTVTVTWDPAVLIYQSDANGGSGVSPTVNRSNAASGSLVLAMADPTGFAGRVELLKITFRAGSEGGAAGSLALAASEVTGAGTFTDLLPKTIAVTYPLVTR